MEVGGSLCDSVGEYLKSLGFWGFLRSVTIKLKTFSPIFSIGGDENITTVTTLPSMSVSYFILFFFIKTFCVVQMLP